MNTTIEKLLHEQNLLLKTLIREVRKSNPRNNFPGELEANPCDEISLGPSKPVMVTAEEPKTWVIAALTENYDRDTGRLTPLNEFFGLKKDAELVLAKYYQVNGQTIKLFTVQEYFDLKHQTSKKANQQNVPSQNELEAMLTDLFNALIPKMPPKPKEPGLRDIKEGDFPKNPFSNN